MPAERRHTSFNWLSRFRGPSGAAGFAAAGLGFMMGRAVILGSLSPFGLSYFAATVATTPGVSLVVGIAVLLGCISSVSGVIGQAGGLSVVELPAAMGSMALLYMMSKAVKGNKAPARLIKLSAASFVSQVTVKCVLMALGEWNPYVLLVVLFEGLLCAALTVIFALGLRALESGTPLDRPYSTEETTCTAALLACAVAGIGGLKAGPVLVKNVVGSALTAIVGYAGGSTAGAAAGVAFGLISSLSGTAQPVYVGIEALAGLMAGMFRDLGRLGSFSGFLLGSVAMSLYTGSPATLVRSMLEAASGAAAVLVAPPRVYSALKRLLSPEATGPSPGIPSADEPVARLRGYSMAMREISRAFDQAYAAAGDEGDRMPRLFGAIASRVCEQCHDFRRCWESDFRSTYRAMFEMIKKAEESGSLPLEGPESAGWLKCRFPDRVAMSINHLVEIDNMAKRWQRRVAEGREILATQMRIVSRLMDETAVQLLSGTAPAVAPESRILSCASGVAQANKKGFETSGDSVLIKEIKHGRLLAALSDGMGAGAPAAAESKMAVSLVETLMEAGFDRDAAVGTVNSVLVARAAGEAFATLDLVCVDLSTGDAEFVKIGACPSFIKRGNEVSVIRTQSLPAGILSEIPVETVPRRLLPNDIVVLVTDGVLQARKDPSMKEPWVASFLARSRWMGPQELAEKILERAAGGGRIEDQEIKDDMTVAVLHFPGV